MPGQETELHPDDSLNIAPIQLKCTSCGGYMKRQAATDEKTRSRYTYVCQAKGCGTDVDVLVPRSS